MYGGIAEPTGEETKGERKGSSEQTKRKPCTEGTCGGIYPVKLCNSTGLGPGQGGARGVRGGAGRGPGQRAITVHGDGARVHGKVQGPGQGAITVHGDSVRVRSAKVHGRAREGAGHRGSERSRCTGTVHGCTGRCRKTGKRAITVHGDGEGQGGDRGRARQRGRAR